MEENSGNMLLAFALMIAAVGCIAARDPWWLFRRLGSAGSRISGKASKGIANSFRNVMTAAWDRTFHRNTPHWQRFICLPLSVGLLVIWLPLYLFNEVFVGGKK